MTNTWVSSEYLKKGKIGQFLGLYGLRSVQGSRILLKMGQGAHICTANALYTLKISIFQGNMGFFGIFGS